MEMKSVAGVVFYVDVLGVSQLTKELISIKNHPHIEGDGSKNINQYVAAWILKEFRKALVSINRKYKNISIAQLSDSAFLWSENSEIILWGAAELMWKLLPKGLLCRGGIAFGEIICPIDEANSLGKFITGSAVTRAVELEKKGKGCRIFSDTDFPLHALEYFSRSSLAKYLVQPLKILTDYSIVDEFKWYLLQSTGGQLSVPMLDKKYLKCLALKIMSLEAKLRFSPLFSWNSSSAEGLIHLAATLEAITSSISIFIKDSQFERPAEYAKDFFDNEHEELIVKYINNYKETIDGVKWRNI